MSRSFSLTSGLTNGAVVSGAVSVRLHRSRYRSTAQEYCRYCRVLLATASSIRSLSCVDKGDVAESEIYSQSGLVAHVMIGAGVGLAESDVASLIRHSTALQLLDLSGCVLSL
jgi:hypothetical protein